MASRTTNAVVLATTEKGDDDESLTSSLPPGDDVVLITEAQAIIPQPQPERRSLSRVTEGLTWEDDYYNDKEDIVAVFDMDPKTLSDYYYFIAGRYFIQCYQVGLPVFVLCIWYPYWPCGVVLVAIVAYFFFHIYNMCLFARVAASAKIHMAVTSDCIMYDQESPKAHIMVSYSVHCSYSVMKRTHLIYNYVSIVFDVPSYLDPLVERG
jgi:hypothetical protein